MADELGIKLKASLGDYRELIKGISNLEKEIKPIKIKLDLGNARELVDILKKATNLMQGTGSSSAHASVVQTINSNDISQSINLLTRYSVLLEKIKSAKYDGTGFDFGKLNLSELEKYASLLKSALSNGEISRDELNKFKIDLISAEGVIRQFDVELANMRGDEKFAKDIQNATVQLQNLQNQMLSYLKNTPNLSASTRNAIQSRYDNITQIINSGTATDKNVLDARDFFSAIQRDAKIAGEEVESFGGKIRRLFREHFNTAVAMAGVHLLQTAMRELWQNIQDVDAAMTELKKVTDLSDSNALEFMDKAAVKAKELGASMSGYINSVADWSRLGYKLDDAEMLADASQLYLNVGDDVDDINESTSTLISTVRAFKLEASDAAGVVDKLNEVSNNYATSAGDIGAALARSSAALFAGGNSLEESIALITAAQSTIQNAEKVGGHMRPTA